MVGIPTSVPVGTDITVPFRLGGLSIEFPALDAAVVVCARAVAVVDVFN